MHEKKVKQVRGFYIRHLLFIVATTTVFLSGFAILSNMQIKKIYTSLVAAELNYSDGLNLGYEFQSASDRMTKAIQHYVETNEITYLEQYLNEVKEKTRENAISKLPTSNDEVYLLKLAKNKSDALMNEEFKAIRLMTVNGILIQKIPDEILSFPLSPEEEALPFEKRQNLARNIIFGPMYNTLKSDVNNRVNDYIQLSLSREKVTIDECTYFMDKSILFQKIFLISCIFVIVLVLLIIYFQVVVVLQKYVNCIAEDRPLLFHRVYELNYLAMMYNEIAKTKDKHLAELKQKADLDFLTGIANRGAFEHYVKDFVKSPTTDKGAFMLIDLDNFKIINDTFGHAMGDLVLKKIAEILSTTFRNDDFVARIGGDEFAVWFPDLVEERVHYIIERINLINKDLVLPSREMPGCSLSAGISFFTQGETYKSLYKKADIALYNVKNNGRCGCKIFEQ